MVRVVEAIKAVLIQLEEMHLSQSLQVAGAFRLLLPEMENFLAHVKRPQAAFLNDPFAQGWWSLPSTSPWPSAANWARRLPRPPT